MLRLFQQVLEMQPSEGNSCSGMARVIIRDCFIRQRSQLAINFFSVFLLERAWPRFSFAEMTSIANVVLVYLHTAERPVDVEHVLTTIRRVPERYGISVLPYGTCACLFRFYLRTHRMNDALAMFDYMRASRYRVTTTLVASYLEAALDYDVTQHQRNLAMQKFSEPALPEVIQGRRKRIDESSGSGGGLALVPRNSLVYYDRGMAYVPLEFNDIRLYQVLLRGELDLDRFRETCVQILSQPDHVVERVQEDMVEAGRRIGIRAIAQSKGDVCVRMSGFLQQLLRRLDQKLSNVTGDVLAGLLAAQVSLGNYAAASACLYYQRHHHQQPLSRLSAGTFIKIVRAIPNIEGYQYFGAQNMYRSSHSHRDDASLFSVSLARARELLDALRARLEHETLAAQTAYVRAMGRLGDSVGVQAAAAYVTPMLTRDSSVSVPFSDSSSSDSDDAMIHHVFCVLRALVSTHSVAAIDKLLPQWAAVKPKQSQAFVLKTIMAISKWDDFTALLPALTRILVSHEPRVEQKALQMAILQMLRRCRSIPLVPARAENYADPRPQQEQIREMAMAAAASAYAKRVADLAAVVGADADVSEAVLVIVNHLKTE